MATIPQQELADLGLIHQDLKTINASIQSNGTLLALTNAVLMALLKQGGMEQSELEKLQADLDKLVADFAAPDVAFLDITNSTPVTKENAMANKTNIFKLGTPGTVSMTDVQSNVATMEPLQA